MGGQHSLSGLACCTVCLGIALQSFFLALPFGLFFWLLALPFSPSFWLLALHFSFSFWLLALPFVLLFGYWHALQSFVLAGAIALLTFLLAVGIAFQSLLCPSVLPLPFSPSFWLPAAACYGVVTSVATCNICCKQRAATNSRSN